MINIKTKSDIEKMREAGRVANLAQLAVEKAIRPGISTYELDQIAEKTMRDNGAIPAEKGYPSGVKGVPDFPGSICASINDVVIHGIPSKYDVLKEGDIISVDVKNENQTIAQQLKNFFYTVVGKDTYIIAASSGGLVTVTGK